MLLVRHASAGERLTDPTDDGARGLDRTGRVHAAGLDQALAAYRIDRIVSSPLARCIQTVSPLAAEIGLEIEIRSELVPSASKRQVLRLLRTLSRHALVCTHREVFEMLFGPDLGCEKGGAWLVEQRARTFVPTAYLPPAAPARRRRASLVAS